MRSSIFRNTSLQFQKWRQWRPAKKIGRRMVCRRCGRKGTSAAEECPYYCPECGEDMYSFECMEAWGSDGPGDAGAKRITGKRKRGKRQ